MYLRPYQRKAIDDLYAWFQDNHTGNPVLELSTGAGKSHILAAICSDAMQYENARVLILTHQKELIVQDYQKIKEHGVKRVGIYSAGVGRKEIREVTVAGIQSIHKKAKDVGSVSLIIIDEAHVPNHKQEGIYRNFLADMQEINPDVRVLGLSATPFRLGHGYIHEGSAIFDALISPIKIKDLIEQGYLCRLQSKFTNLQLDTSGVHKRGGEFIDSELQKVVDTDKNNEMAVNEILKHIPESKACLVFCTGIDHSRKIRDLMRQAGVSSEMVTGKTPNHERDRILQDFKDGKIRCVTNMGVLTTGFDNPKIDLLVMLRPTMSPGLYCQMVGRALRVHLDKPFAKILDFAGNISQHGPITNVKPPAKKGEKPGEAPVKVCEKCQEIVHLSVMVCPACGEPFPPPIKEKTRLHQDDIMGMDNRHTLEVTSWRWQKYTSSKSGKTMLRVSYYGALSDPPVKQYFTIWHEGQAGNFARVKLFKLFDKAGINGSDLASDPSDISKIANKGQPPKRVHYEKNGKYFNVVGIEY